MQVLRPESEAEAAALIAEAAANNRTLSIEGGGSKRHLGRLTTPSAVLKLDALREIVSYEPEELVITVRAGTPLAEVEAALAERNQCFGFEPASWSFEPAAAAATIGGTIAAGAAGSRRVVLGGARDHLIGFRAVNGAGEIFKAGGKVVKNVTGYDLPKLAAGSFGTLFTMTELTLRTYPRAATSLTLAVENLDVDSGCALMRRAVGSRFEATGFCYLPRVAIERLGLRQASSLTLIRFEGDAESTDARAHACGETLAVPFATVQHDDTWRLVQQLKSLQASQVLWRLSVPPTAAVGAIAALRPECFVVDWAGGLLWVEPGSASPRDVHAVARQFGGHATLFRGSDDLRRGDVFQPLDAVTAALTKRLKAAFDPHGVLNPGRMYDGV
ncbi:MAG: glycolate oxidase subunit GlcE [Alphaproteobacteria bacterium]|nr:glycolate oxidase subunit GlcE [Alphaproteobacteria bacterium]